MRPPSRAHRDCRESTAEGNDSIVSWSLRCYLPLFGLQQDTEPPCCCFLISEVGTAGIMCEKALWRAASEAVDHPNGAGAARAAHCAGQQCQPPGEALLISQELETQIFLQDASFKRLASNSEKRQQATAWIGSGCGPSLALVFSGFPAPQACNSLCS